ncbi:hypothetical protein N8146_07005 [Ascidiaceihabitans sp.]|nr:hypothetical protein [Ascidiaceihabitans sp.]
MNGDIIRKDDTRTLGEVIEERLRGGPGHRDIYGRPINTDIEASDRKNADVNEDVSDDTPVVEVTPEADDTPVVEETPVVEKTKVVVEPAAGVIVGTAEVVDDACDAMCQSERM